MKLFQPKEWELLWPFYLFSFFAQAVTVSVPFLVIYYLQNGLSLTQVGLLWTIMATVRFFAEVPTGAIADTFGRKTSTIIGFFGVNILWIFIGFAHSFNQFILIASSIALMQTFVSGALESWVYDFLKHHRQEKLMSHYYTKTISSQRLGLIIGPLIGSLLILAIPINKLFMIEGTLSILFATLLFIPREYLTHVRRSVFQHGAQTLKTAKKGFLFVKKNKAFQLFILAGLSITIWSVLEELARTPLLVSFGMPIALLGIYQAVVSAATVGAPFLGNWLAKHLPEKKLFIIMGVGFVVLPLLLFFVKSPLYWWAAFVLIIIEVLLFVNLPRFRAYGQRLIPSPIRATVISSESMIDQIINVVLLLGGGILMDTIGVRNTLALTGVLAIPSLFAFMQLRKKS